VLAMLLAGGPAAQAAARHSAPQTDGHWVGTWACAPMLQADPTEQQPLSNVTLRQIVHVSLGGKTLRVRLSNEFGTRPLYITAAHLALSATGGSVVPGSDHALTFGERPAVQVPPGAILFSDPVAFVVRPMSNLTLSLYLPAQQVSGITFHEDSQQTSYIAKGNAVASTALSNAAQTTSWFFFDGVDVLSHDPGAGAIVVLGDSITDGAYATLNQNRRWTDVLARRLQAHSATAHLAVLNEGIGGNRLYNNHYGESALARFDRDVLSQSGVRYLIVLEGINDIGHLVKKPVDVIDAQQLQMALYQIAGRARTAGIRVYGGTLLPYGGAGYYSDAGEAIREAVNQWIRSSRSFDGVMDFDKLMRDPANPRQYQMQYNHGDHLHPNDAGYQRMGDAVARQLFP